MARRRYRSMSDASLSASANNIDPSNPLQHQQQIPLADAHESARALLHSLHHLPTRTTGKSFLHESTSNLTCIKTLLDRSKEFQVDGTFLLQQNAESGYTPLHSAIIHRDLAKVLLYLRHVTATDESNDRFTQRPMGVLQTVSSKDQQQQQQQSEAAETKRTKTRQRSDSNVSYQDMKDGSGGSANGQLLIQSLMNKQDREGLTPLQLLGKLQIKELKACRAAIQRPTVIRDNIAGFMNRKSSFDIVDDEVQQPQHEEDELQLLTEHLDVLDMSGDDDNVTPKTKQHSYACEVLTFGRPHHCALGVHSGTSYASSSVGNTKTSTTSLTASSSSSSTSGFRPQRVKEFAQDTIGWAASAVAVAAAPHHTLVVQRDGELYAFGLGKGGRLGTGSEQQHCPLPVRVMGPLSRRKVVAVGAAENHSLCVTSEGHVYAWGSNRFGQLGIANAAPTSSTSNNRNNNGTASSSDANCRCLPRRIEDLQQVRCVSVAAGERHSIALSRKGEVYVWGDNSSGQLGVSRRTGIQKVQRVESLCNTDKVAIEIAASSQSTLVLCGPSKGMHTNSIYSWGHGNHVPIKVHFEGDLPNSKSSSPFLSNSLSSRRMLNPIAIACARFHNAAITSDGCVYTWGFHAESLGQAGASKNNANRKSSPSSPQLVSDLLPENGGGIAVALSASEQHTAVVTDTGALYTWGAADGKNVLGHEGKRWQPSPKRVPGIHRAVSVAVAKEHTVVLVGSSFPQLPKVSAKLAHTLEHLAAKKIAEHIDLFNIVPVMIMAERTECSVLKKYCLDFIQLNLDGVLNLAERGAMNQYLNDMLAESLHRPGIEFRDGRNHPFIADVLAAGDLQKPTFYKTMLCSTDDWARACYDLSKTEPGMLAINAAAQNEASRAQTMSRRPRGTSFNNFVGSLSSPNSKKVVSVEDQDKDHLDLIIGKTTDMDLSSSSLARFKQDWVQKELRGTKKRLNQIAKLANISELTNEQTEKLNRKQMLTTKLSHLERAVLVIQKRMGDFFIPEEKPEIASSPQETDGKNEEGKVKQPNVLLDESCEINQNKETRDTEQTTDNYYCKTCNVKCQDETSYVLHNSGRKHRNRIAQVAEQEKAKVAASIIEEKQRQQLKHSTPNKRASDVAIKTRKGWGSTPTPKYKLPPPPHATAQPVTPTISIESNPDPQIKPTDLRNIMDQQANKASTATSPANTMDKPKPDFRQIMNQEQRHVARKQNSATPKAKQPLAVKPKMSSQGPVWKAAPIAPRKFPVLGKQMAPPAISTRCVPSNLLAPTAASMSLQNGKAYSLGDFLLPNKSNASTTPKTPSSAPWAAPQVKKSTPATKAVFNKPKTPEAPSAPSDSKSLREIQQEEADFKARQDETFGKEAGSWYIERRERADSIQAIQTIAEKDREEQLMIEEQYRIEAQILNELEMKKKQECKVGPKPKKQPKKNKGPRNAKPYRSLKPSSDTNDAGKKQGTNKNNDKKKSNNNGRKNRQNPKAKQQGQKQKQHNATPNGDDDQSGKRRMRQDAPSFTPSANSGQ